MLNHQIRNTLIRVDRHGQLGIQVALLNHEVLYGISGIGGVVLINDLLHGHSVTAREDGLESDGAAGSLGFGNSGHGQQHYHAHHGNCQDFERILACHWGLLLMLFLFLLFYNGSVVN